MSESLKERKKCLWQNWRKRNALRSLFFILTLVLLNTSLFAQHELRFQNLTVNDGLSMGTISGIQKDSQGFIWIGTAEGLHRYDGLNFKIYKHKERDSNSLSDSYIRCIATFGNTLFAGNNSGTVDIMDTDQESFSSVNPRTYDSNFDFPISALLIHKNHLYIGSEGGGLWAYHINNQSLNKVEFTFGKANIIRDLKTDGTHIYVVTDKNIYQSSKGSFSLKYSAGNELLSCISPRKDGFLIGTNLGLKHASASFQSVSAVKLPPRKRNINSINAITSVGDDAWIGTAGGIVHLEDGEYHVYASNVLRPYYLVNNAVSTVYVDDNNIVWVGTMAGISRYSPQLQKLKLVQYFDWEDNTYNSNIYSIYQDKRGTIWAGTLTSGLVKFNNDMSIAKVYPSIKDKGVESHLVRSLFEDSQGTFWVGTRDEGLFRFNRETEKFTLVANRSNGKLKGNVIRDVYEDKEGNLWVGTQAGLYHLDRTTSTTTHYLVDSIAKPNNRIYQISQIPETQKLIIATFSGGIKIFDKETKSFTTFKHNKLDSTSISSNNAMSMAWVNKDSLLIGTYGGGLNILDINTFKFSHITEEDGLINNVVYGIIYNGNGETWMSTNNGLTKINFRKKDFINFTPVHNLQSKEFNEGAFAKTTDGRLFFGGVYGINYFNPASIKFDSIAPKMVLTELKANQKNKSGNTIDLSYLDSRIELDFRALEYSNPHGIKYRYKLEGYDKDWIDLTEGGSVTYPRLTSGSYTFNAEATDEFGSWTSTLEPLKINVASPFWKRWWFLVLCVAFSLLLIYLFLRYRTRQIESSYKLQLIDSELAALRSQMNPHFIFNSLNSIQYYILKKEPKEAYTYLSKFASLMRKILQNSRLKFINLHDEIDGLNLYLEMEKMRMDERLNFAISTKNIDDLEATYIPTMLIQPFVENSIVHGLLPKKGERNLTVLISKEGENLFCVIEDNGIGRVASNKVNKNRKSKHNSAGMSLTKRRLEILSEGKGDYNVELIDLYDEDIGIGTRVEMRIPIINQKD